MENVGVQIELKQNDPTSQSTSNEHVEALVLIRTQVLLVQIDVTGQVIFIFMLQYPPGNEVELNNGLRPMHYTL